MYGGDSDVAYSSHWVRFFCVWLLFCCLVSGVNSINYLTEEVRAVVLECIDF